MEKYNVIIDTNIIVSVFISNKIESPTYKVLELFFYDKINVYYSKEILKEYVEVLNREKFNFDKDIIKSFLVEFTNKAILFDPKHIKKILIDKKDIPFYEIVMDKNIGNAKLITGNIKHFPVSTKIITPKKFIELIQDNI